VRAEEAEAFFTVGGAAFLGGGAEAAAGDAADAFLGGAAGAAAGDAAGAFLGRAAEAAAGDAAGAFFGEPFLSVFVTVGILERGRKAGCWGCRGNRLEAIWLRMFNMCWLGLFCVGLVCFGLVLFC
jgi:hypothetical protein